MTLLGDAALYGVSRLTRTGGKHDKMKKRTIRKLEKIIATCDEPVDPESIDFIISGLQQLISNDAITGKEAFNILVDLDKGSMNAEEIADYSPMFLI